MHNENIDSKPKNIQIIKFCVDCSIDRWKYAKKWLIKYIYEVHYLLHDKMFVHINPHMKKNILEMKAIKIWKNKLGNIQGLSSKW